MTETKPELNAAKLLYMEQQIAEISQRQRKLQSRNGFWLSHHYADQHKQRCFKIGSHHVCRRCSALYPLGFIVAFATALGFNIWPNSWDMTAIWLLALPGTIAYVAEAIGLISYSPKVQFFTTLVTALAFGKGLGYELVERWSYEFWAPLSVFAGVWFLATAFANSTAAKTVVANRQTVDLTES